MKPRVLILVLLNLVFGAVMVNFDAALAAERPYRLGPISSALGGAGRAAVDPTEAGWLNPAALVHVRMYHSSISQQQSSRDLGGAYRDLALVLADGGEDKIAAGSLSYIRRSTFSTTGTQAEQQDIQASLAGFIPSQRISIGATYHRLMHTQPGADVNQDNYSLGLLFPMAESVGVGIVGTDLAGTSDAVPGEARMSPSLGLGIHAMPHSILHLRGDLVRPLRNNPGGRTNAMVGVESWFRPDFAFRIGGAWLEERDEMWATVGIGFKGPRLSFGYSFEKETRSADGTRHTFDLWSPL